MKEITLDDGTVGVIIIVSAGGSEGRSVVLLKHCEYSQHSSDILKEEGEEFGEWLARDTAPNFYEFVCESLVKSVNSLRLKPTWKKA